MSLREQFEAWWNTERMATAFDSFREVAWESFQAGHAVNADLLEACEKALAEFEHWQIYGHCRTRLQEAIKKARGEQ